MVVSDFFDGIVKEQKQQKAGVGNDDVEMDLDEVEMMKMMGIPVWFDLTKGRKLVKIIPPGVWISAYYGHQGQQIPQVHKSMEPIDATLCRNLGMHLDGFGEGLPQFPVFSEDDLQRIVQMGFGPKQTLHMKIKH